MDILYFILLLIWIVQIKGNDFQEKQINEASKNTEYDYSKYRYYKIPTESKRSHYKKYGESAEHLNHMNHDRDNEFKEFYRKTSYAQDISNEMEPKPPYFLAKSGRRGPPSGIYRTKDQMVKLIPGYTHMQATVVPSANGNKIILSPKSVGHRIVVGDLPINIAQTSNDPAKKADKNIKYETSTKTNIEYPQIYQSTKCSEKSCKEHIPENLPETSDPTDSKNKLDVEGSGELESVRSLPIENAVEDNKSEIFTSENKSEISTSENKSTELILNEENEISGRHRFFNFLSNSNESTPTCLTPKDEPGHCRNFGDCVLPDILSNFNIYLQYICVIRAPLLGVCCPDNPVIEIVDPDETVPTNDTNVTIQPSDGCGVNAKTRIVGGTIAKPNEWTWMVALLNRDRFFCGGVLINNWYVLTAAHCVMKLNIKDLSVRLGEYNFNEQTNQEMTIPVKEIKRHANFATRTLQNDIALLRLKQSVQFNRFVSTICLPSSEMKFANVNATVVGWGTVSFGGVSSPILRQATVPTWNNDDCDETYSFEQIDNSFICAGSPDDEQDACQGDSGGPLMSINDQGRWQVIGLVSWGRRCGDPNYPGVYTRVTTYLDWIEENME